MKAGIEPHPLITGNIDAVDITGSDHVEIRIRNDGKVIWITAHRGEEQFGLRICRIETLEIVDERPPKIKKS